METYIKDYTKLVFSEELKEFFRESNDISEKVFSDQFEGRSTHVSVWYEIFKRIFGEQH